VHFVQDGVDHRVVADLGVDHHVVQLVRGPFHPEILAHEKHALAIDVHNLLFGLLFGFSGLAQTADLFIEWGIDENMERVGTVAQQKRSAASHDHRAAVRGGPGDDALHKSDHAVGIEMIQLAHRKTLLHGAAHEDFHEPVKHGVAALVHALHHRLVHFGQARDLAGELLIPELPAEALGELLRDDAAAGAVLALDGDRANQSVAPAEYFMPARFRRVPARQLIVTVFDCNTAPEFGSETVRYTLTAPEEIPCGTIAFT
jgi:hypothetical protein